MWDYSVHNLYNYLDTEGEDLRGKLPPKKAAFQVGFEASAIVT